MNREHQQRALNSLRGIVQALRVSSRASEKAVGMSTAQLFVLRQVALAGTCSVTDLAARTLTHASSVSVVVARLVDHGFVERNDAAQDRRRAEISCTPAGLARLSGAPPLVQDRLIAAMSTMDTPMLASLVAGLEHLAAGLGEAEQPVAMFFDGDDDGPSHQKTKAHTP